MTGHLAAAVWLAFAWTFIWYAIIRPTLRHRRAVKVYRDWHIKYLIRTKVSPGSREAETL